jgi:hypothetical protein
MGNAGDNCSNVAARPAGTAHSQNDNDHAQPTDFTFAEYAA